MSETTNLGLPLVQAAQAQKHVTVNEAFEILDAVSQITLESVGDTVPPVSPADGDAYGVGTGAGGSWLGQGGKIAVFVNNGWLFVAPRIGWRVWRQDTGTAATFDGVDWVDGAGALSANGAGFVHKTLEVDHVLASGGSSTVPALIPANTIVYGITGRVLSAIGGATAMDIGVSGSTNRYGSGIGVAADSWARGITGNPLAYYAETDLILTATGGAFDGTGTFRVAVHFAELTLPRA